jgi:hypothetical protein
VRVNLVKLLQSLVAHAAQPSLLLTTGRLAEGVAALARHDTSLLVKNVAAAILRACDDDAAGSVSARSSDSLPSPRALQLSSSSSTAVGTALVDSVASPSLASSTASASSLAASVSLRNELEHLKHAPQKNVVWIDDSELRFEEKLGSGASGTVWRGYVGISCLRVCVRLKFKCDVDIIESMKSRSKN